MRSLFISRDQRKGLYCDVLDYLETKSVEHGSAVNAAAMVIRNTPDYRRWKAEQKRTAKP